MLFVLQVQTAGQKRVEHEGYFWEKYEFENALLWSIAEVIHNSEVGLIGGGEEKPISTIVEIESDNKYGSWITVLTSWRESGANDIITVQGNASIINNNGEFEFIFTSQAINKDVFATVDLELFDEIEDIIDEYDDMEINSSNDGEHITISAIYSFEENTNEIDVSDRLKFLFRSCRKIMYNAEKYVYEANDDRRDKLEDAPLKYLSSNDFSLLITGLDKFKKESEVAEEGYYAYKYAGKYRYEIYNYGDSLEFLLNNYTSNNYSENIAIAINSKLKEYLDEEGLPEGASKVITEYFYSTDGNLGFTIEANYSFDGSFNGDNYKDFHKSFHNNYSQDYYDEVEDYLEDAVDVFEEYQSKLNDKKLTYLKKEDVPIVLDDSTLLDNEKGYKVAIEGGYQYVLKKRWYQLFNYGKKFVVRVGKTVNEIPKESIKEIMTKLDKYISENGLAKGSINTEATKHDSGNGTFIIFCEITFEFDGSYTNGDFKEYHDNCINNYLAGFYNELINILDE